MIEAVVRVQIEGRVQGVWFRAWTTEQARARGLAGWVRNRRDGTVEALFAGSREAVDEMIAACHRGSPASNVTGVSQLDAGVEEIGGDRFVQRPTV